MSRAIPRKVETEISFKGGRSLLWSSCPHLVSKEERDKHSDVLHLKDFPSRVTPKFLNSISGDSTEVTVYHQFILRSDYWAQTSHPCNYRSYEKKGGNWVCVKTGSWTA